jgi:hypothetical protein
MLALWKDCLLSSTGQKVAGKRLLVATPYRSPFTLRQAYSLGAPYPTTRVPQIFASEVA